MKEDEPTSSESHEKIKDEIVNTVLEMDPWGDMHEELKNEKMTLFPRKKSILFNCLRKWKPPL